MNRRITSAAAALALAAALAGCGGGDGDGSGDGQRKNAAGPDLTVLRPYIPAPANPDIAAGYFTVRNSGGAADHLVRVTSEIADVTLHRTEGSRMLHVEEFDVPAGGELVLDRGGNHLMLEKLRRTPAVGDTVELKLHFATSDPIDVEVPVEPLTYRPKE